LQAVGSAVVQILWIPVAVFEIVLAVWLIAKGVTDPTAEVANAE